MFSSAASLVCFLAILPLPSYQTAVTCSAEVKSLEAVVEKLSQDLTSVQAQVIFQDQEISDLRAAANQRVAFSAYVAHGRYKAPVVQGETLYFESITTNVGGGYNPTTSAFTAPHPGLYFFLVHVDVDPHYRAVVVTLNGNPAFEADNDHGDGHVTGSSVLTLHAGDVVSAEHFQSGGEVDPGIESTFTGFLVK